MTYPPQVRQSIVTKRTDTLTDDELIARYIMPNPAKPGADQAIIAGYGVSVWALVGYLRGTNASVRQVAADYDLPADAVDAAMAYYRQHKTLIDSRIALNDAGFA